MKTGADLREKYPDNFEAFQVIMQAQTRGDTHNAHALVARLDAMEKKQFTDFARDYKKVYPPTLTINYDQNTSAKPFNEKKFHASNNKPKFGNNKKGGCNVS